MSLDLPATVINIIPPTPDASATACAAATFDPPYTAVAVSAAAAAAAADDDEDDEGDEMLQSVVADDRIDVTSEWLRRHVDVFTHLREGLINVTVLA